MISLKENPWMAQDQQKRFFDQNWTEREFEVGDMVYLRLQPYRQSSLKKRWTKKLWPWFFGPFKILRRVGKTIYELELPPESRIHNTFHVSLLKKVVGQQIVTSTQLPQLETRSRGLRSRELQEYLVKWKDLPKEDSTWEGFKILSHLALKLLEGKQFEGGGFVTSPLLN